MNPSPDLRTIAEEIYWKQKNWKGSSGNPSEQYDFEVGVIASALASVHDATWKAAIGAVPEKQKEVKDIRKYWFCEKCGHKDQEVWHSSSVYYCRYCGKKLMIKEIGDEVYDPEIDAWNAYRTALIEAALKDGVKIE